MSNENQEIELGPWKPEADKEYFVGGTNVSFSVTSSQERLERPDNWHDDYLAFETEEEARQCALSELATRKLKRFAKQLNPPGWKPKALEFYYANCTSFYSDSTGAPAGVIPFYSEEACIRAWSMLSEEEKESLFEGKR